ncbi:MAG: hypothetical protein ISR65_20660 [Bacteriovoracaceae bacterium]|nr:hypothetical protein [Bacteriovoracaceae bacterium]
MTKLNDLAVEYLEELIEQKLLEIVGDPDSELRLEKGFKEKLERRLRNVPRKVSHDEVLKKFG